MPLPGAPPAITWGDIKNNTWVVEILIHGLGLMCMYECMYVCVYVWMCVCMSEVCMSFNAPRCA